MNQTYKVSDPCHFPLTRIDNLCLDPPLRIFTHAARLLIRCYVSVAILDNQIYAMGGYDGHHRQNTVERYNPRSNQWSMVEPMHIAHCTMHMQRSDACATTLNWEI